MAIIVSGQSSTPDPALFSDIYIDESSQTKHRFLVLGGLIVPTALASLANDEVGRQRLPELPFGELKWNKVSNAKLASYKRVVDAFSTDPPLRQHIFIPWLSIHTKSTMPDSMKVRGTSVSIKRSTNWRQNLLAFTVSVIFIFIPMSVKHRSARTTCETC